MKKKTIDEQLQGRISKLGEFDKILVLELLKHLPEIWSMIDDFKYWDMKKLTKTREAMNDRINKNMAFIYDSEARDAERFYNNVFNKKKKRETN